MSLDASWLEPLIPKEKHQAVSRLSTLTTLTKIECYFRIFEIFLCTPGRNKESVCFSGTSLKQVSCRGVTSAPEFKSILFIHSFFIPAGAFQARVL